MSKFKMLIAGVLLAGISLSACGGSSATEESIPERQKNAALGASCADGGVCAVGDVGPGGGIVFYAGAKQFACGAALERLCRYLEVAPNGWGLNPPTRCTTEATAIADPKCVWADKAVVLGPNTQGVAIGTGFKNSLAVNKIFNTSGRASKAARAYEGGAKKDWYLPAKDELNELCKFAHSQTTGDVTKVCADGDLITGFTADNYWSSSERAAYGTWTQFFPGGSQFDHGKFMAWPVRPIRAFAKEVTTTTIAALAITTTTTTLAPTTTTTTTLAPTCATGGPCAIGETGPGGGVIFYVDAQKFPCGATLATTCSYMEAAPSGWSVSPASGCDRAGNQTTDPICVFSGDNSTLIGSTSWGVKMGSGFKNTMSILGVSSTGGRAASSAQAYRGGGLSDWYLPAREELNAMYLNASKIGGFNMLTNYWSSTEFNGVKAWYQYFKNGGQYSAQKANNNYSVRPVRAG